MIRPKNVSNHNRYYSQLIGCGNDIHCMSKATKMLLWTINLMIKIKGKSFILIKSLYFSLGNILFFIFFYQEKNMKIL